MKELYKSPVVTVEELAKLDVLCSSPVITTPTNHEYKEDAVAQIEDLL